MTPSIGALIAAAVVPAALAGLALARRRDRTTWAYALGMLALAAESAVGIWLVAATETPADRDLGLRAWTVAGLLVACAWAVFVVLFLQPAARLARGWRLALGGLGLVTAGLGTVAATAPPYLIADVTGAFYAARLDTGGRAAVIAELLLTVAVLAGLEAALRRSRATERWRTKYLALGLGAIFAVRFYFQAQVLLFHTVLASYLAAQAVAVTLGGLLTGVALRRQGLLAGGLAVSRQVVFRSVVVGTLGAYLFVVGVLGWLLDHLGVAEALFWGTLVIFASALALGVLLLSEDIRWRLKRFIALHFYRTKYDYREQWIAFTKRLGSLVTLDQLAPALLSGVADAVGATRGVLYLAGPRTGHGERAAVHGPWQPPATLELPAGLAADLAARGEPEIVENGNGPLGALLVDRELHETLAEGGAVVPLRWRGDLVGLMLLGPERTRAPYNLEDRQFLATVAEQAAGALVTARLSESLAQAREFEAFHRLTSFVVHDLKNSIAALSLLSQNALANFDDPEFQRDAIKTLSRTVERMKALLARLASSREAPGATWAPLSLPAVVQDAVGGLSPRRGIRLRTELGPAAGLRGDAEALARVVQNLVINGMEAIAGEGEVTVKTYEDGRWGVVEVTDTGCGIPAEFLRTSLFAPFRTTKKGGWGVGLYHAKTIVEAHGGTIEVSTKEGQGTTFMIRLPREATT
ncbi:MAG TPA: XrtA/PEP-CTERM system histidine kinase PrsK [Candidatus Binatia bacterium]|nr:XrtA/PEP-CTERM system histidine kinase PrsK [Candidatus Binatia bacterium]